MLHAQNGAHCSVRHFVDVMGAAEGADFIWSRVEEIAVVPELREHNMMVFGFNDPAFAFRFFLSTAEGGVAEGRTSAYVKRYIATWIRVCQQNPHFKCVLCKGYFYRQGAGHNPAPLANEGVCCDRCNADIMQARIATIMSRIGAGPAANRRAVQRDGGLNINFAGLNDMPTPVAAGPAATGPAAAGRRQIFTEAALKEELKNEECVMKRFGMTCPICITDFKIGDRLLAGRCGHRLHEDCYAEFVETSPDLNCPECREKTMAITPEEYFTVAVDEDTSAAAGTLYMVVVTYDEGGILVIKKYDKPFDAMEVKVRLSIDIFKKHGVKVDVENIELVRGSGAPLSSHVFPNKTTKLKAIGFVIAAGASSGAASGAAASSGAASGAADVPIALVEGHSVLQLTGGGRRRATDSDTDQDEDSSYDEPIPTTDHAALVAAGLEESEDDAKNLAMRRDDIRNDLNNHLAWLQAHREETASCEPSAALASTLHTFDEVIVEIKQKLEKLEELDFENMDAVEGELALNNYAGYCPRSVPTRSRRMTTRKRRPCPWNCSRTARATSRCS
jgi:hypothetical protein